MRQGLSRFLFPFVEVCESSTYTALIFLILVSALWRVEVQGTLKAWDYAFLFLVAHPRSLGHGG